MFGLVLDPRLALFLGVVLALLVAVLAAVAWHLGVPVHHLASIIGDGNPKMTHD